MQRSEARDWLAVYEGAGWELLKGLGDLRKLVCEKVSSPGPERHPGRILASEAAVTVKLDFVEPFRP